MVDFGWSASCILEAIRLSNKIRKALQDAGGAKDQYGEATLFLTQFESVFRELEGHIRHETENSYREEILQQLKLMEAPISRLESLLSKYEKSLGDNSAKSKVRTIAHKIKWGLKDLNDAVRTADELLGPLQTVSLLLQMASMYVNSYTTLQSAHNARKTIRATNETCQKMVNDIEESTFVTSLRQEIEQIREHSEEYKVHQQENRAYLASLKCSLDLQHSEILDALQNERQAYEALTQSTHVSVSEYSDDTITLSKDKEIYIDEETSFERMHAQLEAQQNSLDDVCRALECLTSEINHKATGFQASQEPAIQSSLSITDAMSIIRIAVTVGSIFALGNSTIPTLSNMHLNEAHASEKKPTEFHDVLETCRPESGAAHELETWTAEFSDFSLEPLQDPETHVHVSSPQMAHNISSSSVSSSHRDISDYYTWRCCRCDNGPYTKSRTTCWGCWTPHCEHCPRITLPSLDDKDTAPFKSPKYEHIEYHHPDTGHRAWRWNFWAPRPSRATAPMLRSNMRKGFRLQRSKSPLQRLRGLGHRGSVL